MSSKPVLLEPRQAIFDYLDALLREIPDADAAPAPVALAAPAEIQDWEVQDWDPVAPAGAPEPEPEVLAAPVMLPEPESALEAVAEVELDLRIEAVEVAAPSGPSPEPESAPSPAPAGPPEWARPEFQALLFDVGGLTLAVPLVKLHSVVPWSDQVTPMPRQPEWCHGLLRYREHNVRVIDTAALVIPQDKRPRREPVEPRHILVVGDGRWALSCHAIGEVIRLDADAVKWRSGQGLRPWLAGTVRERLCALLDTEAFADMLAARH